MIVNALKKLLRKKPDKDRREQLLLFGLVDLYLETGCPVSSNSLKEQGFETLSSATIRNDLAKLEQQGYLVQQHSSGGRIPTSLAYKHYAAHYLNRDALPEKEADVLAQGLNRETREVARYLQSAAEAVSAASGCAVFLSSPRFDHDFVLDVKLISLDETRALCVILTDFGEVHTSILHLGKRTSNQTLKKIEAYFHARLMNLKLPSLSSCDQPLADRLYNEVMLRHLANASHFTLEEIYKTGFSKLVQAGDISDTATLASSLSLFENTSYLRSLLKECGKLKQMRCWIADDLRAPSFTPCSVVAAPYAIHQTYVGAIGILGPHRLPYRKIFAILKYAAAEMGKSLTKSLYKFQITFRQPREDFVDALQAANCLMLEDKKRGKPA